MTRNLLAAISLALLASCNGCGKDEPACGSPLVDCGGGCVDPRTDEANCGACGASCLGGQVCTASVCEWSCPAGQVACDGSCVDPLTDRLHCGASGTCTGAEMGASCATGQACVAGGCQWSCPAGQVNCGGFCVNPLTDRDHCGASGSCTGSEAGSVCVTGQVCADAVCDWGCPAGQLDCGGLCVNPLTDRLHCGASGTCTGAEAGAACASGEVCAAGACGVSCPSGQVNCGGTCVDPLTDRLHCGAGASCAGSESGAVCLAGQLCTAGACTWSCPTSQIDCGGSCVDPLTDPSHCGGCATRCDATAICAGGACQPSCGDGYSPCLVAGGWACVSLETDDAHCGTCENACAQGWTCAASQCTPICPPTLTVCGAGAAAACTDIAGDPLDCGTCGLACAAGLVCDGGTCSSPCPFGELRCGGACLDTQGDPSNCGGCGAVCPGGASCVSGACSAPACPGQLGLPGVRAATAGYRPVAMAAGDFDRDGRLDLAVADDWTGSRGRILLFRGNGDGTFAPPSTAQTLPHPTALVAGDLNGDGFWDLVVGTTDPAQGSVRVLAGDGAGGFTDDPALRVATGPAPQALALVDVDGDLDLDLVVGNGPAVAAGNLKVFVNDLGGPTALLGAGAAPGTASFAYDVAADVRSLGGGNFDDTWPDDVVAVSAGGGEILIASGGGALLQPMSGSTRLLAFPVGTDPVAIAVADLNDDFFPDWVVANAGSNDVSVLLNDGTGIGIGQSHAAGLEPRAVVAADLDGDGATDLATANGGGGTVTALRNTTRLGPCPGTCFDGGRALPAGLRPAALVAARPTGPAAVHLFVADSTGRAVTAIRVPSFATIESPRRVDGAPTSEAIALGSLDADAQPDAVTADVANDRLQLWTGAAGGFLPGPTDVALAAGAAPVAVAIADLDADGAGDVVAALEGLGALAVFWGDGLGGVSGPDLLPTGLSPEAIAVADLDGDGLDDLVSADLGADRLTVYRSSGGRGWGAPLALATGAAPRSVAAADLDGRGCLDLVSADSGAASLSVFHCDPAHPGQFFTSVAHQPAGASPVGVTTADLEGDGDVDLVLTRAADALVLLNQGFGFFDAGTTVATLPSPRRVVVADLDLDGSPDLVIPDGASGTVSVARGNGDGTFGPATRFAAGGEPRAVQLADLDGDGRPDVVAATATPPGSFLGGGVTVLPNRCAP